MLELLHPQEKLMSLGVSRRGDHVRVDHGVLNVPVPESALHEAQIPIVFEVALHRTGEDALAVCDHGRGPQCDASCGLVGARARRARASPGLLHSDRYWLDAARHRIRQQRHSFHYPYFQAVWRVGGVHTNRRATGAVVTFGGVTQIT